MMKRYKQTEIEELAEILKNDGVISVPTDTVYGVCARINSKKAHDNLVKTKNRPITKPFPIMCSDEEQIKSIAVVDEIEHECPKLDGMMRDMTKINENYKKLGINVSKI